jgi:hypothetical protein
MMGYIYIYYNITWEWHLAILRCWTARVGSLFQSIASELWGAVETMRAYNIYIS